MRYEINVRSYVTLGSEVTVEVGDKCEMRNIGIRGNSEVGDNTEIRRNIGIRGNSEVGDNTEIRGNIGISGNCEFRGDCEIRGN